MTARSWKIDRVRAATATAFAALVLIALPAVATARDGDLNRAFSGDGRVVTDLDGGSDDRVGAVLNRGDRTLLAGASIAPPRGVRLAIVAYGANGSLDRGFGAGGIVLSDAEGGMFARAIGSDSFGQLVVAGEGGVSDTVAVARFNGDGSPDPTFGGDGMVTLPLDLDVGGMRTDGNQRVFVAGTRRGIGASEGVVLCLTRFGALDPTFGEAGVVSLPLAGNGSATGADMLIDALDRIAVAGGAWLPAAGLSRKVGRFALARLEEDGSLDRSLRGDGTALIGMGRRGGFATALAYDNLGRLVLAGMARPDAASAAVREDGSLDPRFGRLGRVRLGLPSGYAPTDIADDRRARTVTALGAEGRPSGRAGRMLAVRLRRDGSLDRSFGRRGRVSTGFGRYVASADSVALNSTGGLFLAGTALRPGSGSGDFALASYLAEW